jgi:putative nucleotidyltransferase with HDIG domain
MSAERLADQLQAILLKRIQADQLVLPTLPPVATKALEVLRNPEAGPREAAAVVERDPVLAARVLRSATSAAFAAGTSKINVREAIARIGTRALKNILVEASAQQVFVSRNPTINNTLRALWEHSVAVAGIARDVLALVGGTDSESAYLAGLLHDVGKPVVATVLLEVERQLTESTQRNWLDTGEWIDVIAKVHRPVGVALADKWQLPAVIAATIRDSGEFNREDRQSLANAVCFANALAKKAGVHAGTVDQADNDALIMIGRSALGLNDEVVRTLSKSVRERIVGIYD